MVLRILLAGIFPSVLFACSSSLPPPQHTEAWRAPDPGLLLDAAFIPDSDDRRLAWGYSQHGGAASYHYEVAEGILSIERIGPEPWGQATQRIDPKIVDGRMLEFSAELAGTFKESPDRQVQATGIGIRVLGYPPGAPIIAGRHILLVAEGEPALGPGSHDWTRQTLSFEIPTGATDIEVSIRLGMYGRLEARGPSLRTVDAKSTPPMDAPSIDKDVTDES